METGPKIYDLTSTEYYHSQLDLRMKEEAYKQAMLQECAYADAKAAELGIDISYLTLEQRAIVSAIADPSHTDNVHIQAAAGTGKTTTLNAAIRLCEAAGLCVLTCAPTHKAAGLLHGHTLHNVFNWRGEGRGALTEKKFETVAHAKKELKNADILIVDEISMVALDEWDSVSASVAKAEAETGHTIKLVTSGDVQQLKPVVTEEDVYALSRRYPYIDYQVTEDRYGIQHPSFPLSWWFFADSYTDLLKYPNFPVHNENRQGFRLMTLTKCMRIEDADYLAACNRIGRGDRNGVYDINRKVKIYDRQRDTYDGRSIYLTGRRDAAEKFNLEIIDQLIDRLDREDPNRCHYMVPAEATYYKGFSHLATQEFKGRPGWTKYSNAPEYSYAIPGMRVVMCATVYAYNGPDAQIIAHNGETGVIVKTSEGMIKTVDDPLEKCGQPKEPDKFTVTIQLDSGKKITIGPQQYDLTIPAFKARKHKIEDRKIGYVMSMPYLPGYAMTIHRAQGSTYESIVIDPDTFAAGQLYVALTRCRGFSGLRLTRMLEPRDVITDPCAMLYLQNPNFFPLNLRRKLGLPE